MSERKLRDALARALERCEVADDPSGAADEAAAILREAVDLDGRAAATIGIKIAEEAIAEAQDRLQRRSSGDLRDDRLEPAFDVALQWIVFEALVVRLMGGRRRIMAPSFVIWLNMFDFVNYEDAENPHFCIDVRQFNSAGKIKGEGVFTMARQLQRGAIPDEPEGNVKGHGWNGGYLVSILTDPDGQETHTDDEREF